MKVTESLFLVGSGALGVKLTDALDCNVYAVDTGPSWFLVDAGCGRRPPLIRRRLRESGLSLDRLGAVFLTHGHADHAAGARYWKDSCGAEVVASSLTAKWLRNGDREASGLSAAVRAGGYPKTFAYPRVDVDTRWREGSRRRIGRGELLAVRTDGHCAGHLSLLWRERGMSALFSGDALLPGGRILLTTLGESNLHTAVASARRLDGLKFDFLCPGHGRPQPYREAKAGLVDMRARMRKLLPPRNYL